MKKSTIYRLPSVIAGLLFATTALAEPKTIKDGVYTEAKAECGKAVFEQYCKSCHVKEFYQAKFAAWKGAPLIDLYESMSATMPEDNAGSLTLQEYSDVLAYIFSLLEYPAGEAPLDYDNGSMADIIIEP